MDEFSNRLAEIRRAIESNEFKSPEEFSGLAVEFGKSVALATLREMLARSNAGASELEIMAAFPFALAFMINMFMHCTDKRGDAEVVDRLMESATRLTHALGDGEPNALPSKKSPARSH